MMETINEHTVGGCGVVIASVECSCDGFTEKENDICDCTHHRVMHYTKAVE